MSLHWQAAIGKTAGFLAFSAPHWVYVKRLPDDRPEADQSAVIDSACVFYINGTKMGRAPSPESAKIKAETALAMVRRETARRLVLTTDTAGEATAAH